MALFNLIDHVHMLLKKLRFWVLSSVINYCLTRTWHVMSSQTSILKSFVIYWTSSLSGFTRRGRLLLVKWRSRWMFYHLATMHLWWDYFGTFIIVELVLFSIYKIMLLICCLKSWIVFLTGAWIVFLGLLTLGRVETVWIGGARKNSVATMPGESLMDIELSDSYIHCEYFSIVRRKVTCLLTSLYRKKSRIFRLSRI